MSFYSLTNIPTVNFGQLGTICKFDSSSGGSEVGAEAAESVATYKLYLLLLFFVIAVFALDSIVLICSASVGIFFYRYF